MVGACAGEDGGPGAATADDPPREPVVIAIPADAPTIQAGVDRAEPGDLVLVAPGTYHESVTVETDGITIRGEDRNTVVLDGQDALEHGVRVVADGVAVENLTARSYRSAGVLFTGDHGQGRTLTGYRASHLTTHANGSYGVAAFNARGGLVEDVWASGHLDAGIAVHQCRPCDTVVRRATAAYNGAGYQGTNAGGNLLVVESVWRNNRVGLHPNSSDREELAPQHDTSIVGNAILDNSDPAAPRPTEAFGIGVAVGGGTANLIERNRIEGHASGGVVIADQESYLADGNVVRGNVLGRNGVDLAMATRAAAPRGNCFSGNTFSTSSPPDIEARFACAPESQGGNGSPVALTPPPQAGTVPPPPSLPSMPDVRRIPAAAAAASPPSVDLTALAVPSPG